MRVAGWLFSGVIVFGSAPAVGVSRVAESDLRLRPAVDLDVLSGEIQGVIEGKLGRNLSVPWTLKWAEPGRLPPGRTAMTNAATDGSGKLESCVTRLGSAADALTESELVSLSASGVFSCFQVDLLQSAGFAELPRWLRLGAQAWVGEMVSGGTSLSSTWWDAWLGEPVVPLHARTFDAIGWFASVEASTAAAWSLLDPLMRDPTMYARIDHKALEQWPTRLARRADVMAWESTGPGITATRAEPEQVQLAAGASHQVQVTADTVRFLKVATEADILELLVVGPIGGGLAGTTAASATLPLGTTSLAVCLRPEGCACPDGSTAVPGLLGLVGPSVDMAVVAVGENGKVDVSARKLDDVCPSPTSALTTAAPSGLVGGWVSTGWEMPADLFGTVSGGAGIGMAIDVDGSIGVDWNPMTPVVTVQDASGSRVATTITITGTMAGTVEDVSGTALAASYTSNDVAISVAVNVDGAAVPPFTMTADDAAARYGLSLPITNARATVEGNTLRLSQEIPGGEGEIAIVFERQ